MSTPRSTGSRGGGHRRAHAGSHAAATRARGGTLLVAVSLAVAVLAAGAWWLSRVPAPRGDQLVADGGAETTTAPGTVPGGTADWRVRLGDDGSARVSMTLTFPEPVDRLDLAVPAREGIAAETDPRLTALVLEADGRAVAPPERPLIGTDVSVPLPEPSTRVVLTYTAEGVTVRTEPSQPTRALALLTPLVVRQTEGSPWRVGVDSVKVRNLGCAGPDGELTSCGTSAGETWTVEGSGGEQHTDVLAQLDLPVS
jgi:hypothetical protein